MHTWHDKNIQSIKSSERSRNIWAIWGISDYNQLKEKRWHLFCFFVVVVAVLHFQKSIINLNNLMNSTWHVDEVEFSNLSGWQYFGTLLQLIKNNRLGHKRCKVTYPHYHICLDLFRHALITHATLCSECYNI